MNDIINTTRHIIQLVLYEFCLSSCVNLNFSLFASIYTTTPTATSGQPSGSMHFDPLHCDHGALSSLLHFVSVVGR